MAAAASYAETPSVTLIHAGSVFDSVSGQVRSEQTIRVVGDTIEAIENSYLESSNGAQIIDLKDHFVMPGLIDMHVHIVSQTSPKRLARRFTWEPGDHAYESVAYAQRTLMAGFTTVRDLGTAHGLAQSMRDAIARGAIVGPRIFTAGKSLATTGGHADPTNGVNTQLRGDPGPDVGVIKQPSGRSQGGSCKV